MLNSRKLFKALAVTGLLSLGSIASYAQTCTTVGVTPGTSSRALRPEGLTEATADVVVSGCTGLPDPFNVTIAFTGYTVVNSTSLPAALSVGTPTITYGTNSVTFAVAGAGGAGTFTIGGVRLNVTTGNTAPLTPITAQVVITAGLSVILNSNTNVGTVLGPSLNFSVSGQGLSTLAACVNSPAPGSSVATAGLINFVEGTNSVFRSPSVEQASTPLSSVTFKGTQLRAVIANLPAGVSLYLPNSAAAFQLTNPAAPGVALSLKLVSGVSTTASYGTGLGSGKTVLPYTPPAGTIPYSDAAPGLTPTATYGAVTGTEVIYEIVTEDINAIETVALPFIVQYTGGPGVGIGTATATGSLAPVAAGSYPQFGGTGVSANLLTTTICSTTLLYPYVTTDAGFDTGVAISNTSADPIGTAAQSGTCSINAYGAYGSGSTVPAAGTSPSIAAGRTWAFSATDSAVFASGAKLGSGFNGYLIAQCNFQLGHGYAFISTYGLAGANSVAQGYLALVLPNSNRVNTLGATGVETLGN